MCPIACLPNPLEHIIYTYHIETSSKQSQMWAHAQPCMLLLGMCTPHVLHCVFLCSSLSINAPKLIHGSFSCSQTHVGWSLRPVCISTDKTLKSDNHDEMKEELCGKWPNAKSKDLCVCVHMHACLCASALGRCGPVGERRWCRYREIWGVVRCNKSCNETQCSPRLLLTYYHTRVDRAEALGPVA